MLSLLLCLLLALSSMGLTAFAEEAPVSTEHPEETVLSEAEKPSLFPGEQGDEEAGSMKDGTSEYEYVIKIQTTTKIMNIFAEDSEYCQAREASFC